MKKTAKVQVSGYNVTINIPKQIKEILDLQKKDLVSIEITGDKLVIKKGKSIKTYYTAIVQVSCNKTSVNIPKEIRKSFKITKGDLVTMEIIKGELVIKKVNLK